MCRTSTSTNEGNADSNNKKKEEGHPSSSLVLASSSSSSSSTISMKRRRRRNKRDKQDSVSVVVTGSERQSARTTSSQRSSLVQSRKPSHHHYNHGHGHHHDNKTSSGGIMALLPSLIGVAVLVCGVMAKMGFRGRPTVAGIDLGTTNSVICVQSPSKGVGTIECIPDPTTQSPIIPSVVSVLEPSEFQQAHASTSAHGTSSSKTTSVATTLLQVPVHPSHVLVGASAKRRIDSHPHHTVFHAKRVLGRSFAHDAVAELSNEVEFGVEPIEGEGATTPTSMSTNESYDGVVFTIPHHQEATTTQQQQQSSATLSSTSTKLSITPTQVGSYVVHYLKDILNGHLGHDVVQSAVICVPAKFTNEQRHATVQAFQHAGMAVTRILEEPTAAALAYGLHKKPSVEYILVYDFGGGTLDVSLLHVTDGFADVMGSDGDDQLGGADFDAAVAHFLLRHRSGQDIVDRVSAVWKQLETQLEKKDEEGTTADGRDLEEVLSAACPILEEKPLCTVSSFHTIGEQLKIGLSAYPNGGGTVEAECLGLPLSMNVNSVDVDADVMENVQSFCDSLTSFRLSLSSTEYKTAVDPLYDRAIVPVHRLLDDLNLGRSEIDEVVMVGGTTRIPEIRRRVQEALGEEATLNTSIDPDITVAYGAASVID